MGVHVAMITIVMMDTAKEKVTVVHVKMSGINHRLTMDNVSNFFLTARRLIGILVILVMSIQNAKQQMVPAATVVRAISLLKENALRTKIVQIIRTAILILLVLLLVVLDLVMQKRLMGIRALSLFQKEVLTQHASLANAIFT